jgi:hypothetical protein
VDAESQLNDQAVGASTDGEAEREIGILAENAFSVAA